MFQLCNISFISNMRTGHVYVIVNRIVIVITLFISQTLHYEGFVGLRVEVVKTQW